MEQEIQIHISLIALESLIATWMPDTHTILLSANCSSLDLHTIFINGTITYHISQTRSLENMLNSILSLVPCITQGTTSSPISSLILTTSQTCHSTRHLHYPNLVLANTLLVWVPQQPYSYLLSPCFPQHVSPTTIMNSKQSTCYRAARLFPKHKLDHVVPLLCKSLYNQDTVSAPCGGLGSLQDLACIFLFTFIPSLSPHFTPAYLSLLPLVHWTTQP